MILKSCRSVISHLIHPPPSPFLPTAQNVFNCNSFPDTKICPIIFAVTAPSTQNRCTTTREFVLKSSTPELVDHPFYPDHERTVLDISAHDQPNSTNKNDDKDLQLEDIWKNVQGSHNWNGMWNPLHPLLLSEIIRYGVFVRACYEAFDLEPGSKFHGLCKYGRKKLFGGVGMENCGYQITKYIYATPEINVPDIIKNKLGGDGSANWIGFVAVTEDQKEIKRLGRRDIVVAFRGTVTYAEWLANLMYILTPARLNPLTTSADVKVAMGMLGLYTSEDSACRFNHGSARKQLLCEIARLVEKYKGEEVSITLTGHSMGSALAILCAYDIAEVELNRCDSYSRSRIPIVVYSFAGPRVGNAVFRDRCEELGLGILRVVNVHDVVTKIPGIIFNENFRVWENVMDRINPWIYAHVGVELALDHKSYTQFFKAKAHHPSYIHDLATYLQLLRSCCGNHHNYNEQTNSETCC